MQMMNQDYLLGIDVGTTNIKVILYDIEGNKIAESIKNTKTHHPKPEWSEYLPEEIWDSVAKGIREVVTETKAAKFVRGVSVGSMGEAGVPLDKEGQPLYPIIAWFDPRTQLQSDWWETNFGAFEVFKITGLPLHPMYSINKLMWLRDNVPEVYSKITKWLCMEDFIIFKLTGEYATSYSIASRTMALDLIKRRWSENIFAASKLNSKIMPQIYPSGTVVGKVSKSAAQQTSLLQGTPVATGGHDHTCGALAVGILEAGSVLDSTGTTEGFVLSLDKPVLTEEVFQHNYAYECHVVPDKYILFGFVMTAGVILDWFRQLVGCEDYEEILAEATKSKPGASGLFLLPHFRGSGTPAWDPASRGAFLGLMTSHTRGDLARAILEGISYEVKYNLETLQELLKGEIQQLRTIGGATRSDFWLQLKADIIGKKIEVPDIYEATSLGAAMLAGIGVGIYKDARDAVGRIYRVRKRLRPQQKTKELYEQYYQSIYRLIYPTITELNREINRRFPIA